MKIRLELAHKKAKVKKVLLKADTIIGRSTDCGLRIASNEVSRQHCKICIGEDGVTIRDLGSSNGTFVNGYQLEPDTDYEIAPDSELSLGGIKFFVRFSEPPEKVMQSDGLGSTVDLKPGQKDELAALEQSARPAPPDEDMHFAEAPETEEEEVADEPEPVLDTGTEAEAPEDESSEITENEDSPTVSLERPSEAVTEDFAEDVGYEMSTHGDSAILERDETEAFSHDQGEEEVLDLERDEPEVPEVAQESEVEDEPVSYSEEEVDPELDAEEFEEEADSEWEDEEGEPVEEDLDQVEEPVAEEEEHSPEPANEVRNDEDVAAFLNQVSDEEDASDNEDESLGDFFKQFE